MREASGWSVRRLARSFAEPAASVGRWIRPKGLESPEAVIRRRPVSGDPEFRARVKALCEEPRHRTFGHRRIRALLWRRWSLRASRKAVCRVMRELGLSRPKLWHRTNRPKLVERMKPTRANEAWQVDMTSFQLADLSPLFLVLVTDCCTRQIVGWTLDRRCRASEWVSALRLALESRRLVTKEVCRGLTLRSDNGAQPCSKKFIEFLGSTGVRGQYTGYNAPDDNAYVERVIRTLKEEEIWPNAYETLTEARAAIESYIRYYNNERIHSALGYQTPSEFAATHVTLVAA